MKTLAMSHAADCSGSGLNTQFGSRPGFCTKSAVGGPAAPRFSGSQVFSIPKPPAPATGSRCPTQKIENPQPPPGNKAYFRLSVASADCYFQAIEIVDNC